MDIEKARFNMIQQQIRPWEVLDPEVLKLLSVVKREDFVPTEYKDLAFTDVELPLLAKGDPSQTMLEPRVEARMLQEVAVKNTDTVLEIGAGGGYMAALLAAKAEFVYTVDIEPALVDMARQNLARAGVANVSVDLGDAAQGWSLYAPYDVIVISASLPFVPETILRSLKVGGRLVAVVGEAPAMHMQLITRTDEDAFTTVNVLETSVAPLINARQRDKFVF
ncbi:protein-L-isoaspartate O-methyltransferase family protein [Propionivibrio limicola]|uniref:protein-L-isoaspartate O-methyltransferase family protein n=1 Tax=Propionivibrio limicola TaxID=167645 RepID=UPI001292374A|nr:protein-L-isoaspartate O-methyltransferase [Propionivibrio limicola]